jgi:hypothetical protein
VLFRSSSSYYPASPQYGEWTLQETKPFDIITLVNTDPNKIEINNGYFLTKNNLEPVLSKGWYGLESKNDNQKWRWTGANNKDPSVALYAQNENKYIDIILNYSAADPSNTFSVFLDGKKIIDCNDNHVCLLNNIYISKGDHDLVFKSKLPARVFGTEDPRSLGYAFSDIKIIVKNEEGK